MKYSFFRYLNLNFVKLSIFFGLFGINVVLGQTIVDGVVVNAQSDSLPFSGIVFLDSLKSKILFSTVANDDGTFNVILDSVLEQEAKNIYAYYQNNQSDTLKLTKDRSLNLIVKGNNVINLLEVEVYGNKTSLARKADRFIYTPSEDIKVGASTLDIIKITPLINYNFKNDFFSILNKSDTQVIINNRKSNLPNEMITSLLRSTPAENIMNIEIITNPGSEYSANTTGGVININLKKKPYDGVSGNLRLSSEQTAFNTTVLNGNINYARGKVGIRFSPFVNDSYEYNSSTLLFEAADETQFTENEYKRNYLVLGGGFGLDYDISEQSLLSINGFISTVSGDSKQVNQSVYSSVQSSTDSILSSPVNGKDNYQYNFGNIYFLQKLGTLNKKKIVANIDYNYFKKNDSYSGSFEKTFPSTSNFTYENYFPQDFFNISSRIDYSTETNEKSKFDIGIQYSSSSFDNNLEYLIYNSTSSTFELNTNLSNRYNYNEDYYALYANKTITIKENLNISLGLRAEGTNYKSENITSEIKIDSNYVNVFPNLSLAYTFKKNNSLSLSLSKNIKRPSIEHLLPGRTYINPSYFEENNPFLQPVISFNGDMMVTLRGKYYFSSGYSLMKNQFDQFIVENISPSGEEIQQKTYVNFGDFQKLYFQFYTRQNWFKNFWESSISGNLNILTYKDKSKKYIKKGSISNTNVDFFFNNTFFLDRKKNLISFLTLRYESPMENSSYKRTNGLFKTDLGLRKTWKQNLSLSIYLGDIFNSYNKTTLLYRPTGDFSRNKFDNQEYTRSITLSLGYTFGGPKVKEIKNKKRANEEIRQRIN